MPYTVGASPPGLYVVAEGILYLRSVMICVHELRSREIHSQAQANMMQDKNGCSISNLIGFEIGAEVSFQLKGI